MVDSDPDPDPDHEDELAGSEMSFGDHLEELRSRLLKAVLSTVAVFFVVFYFHRSVLRLVIEPYTSVARELRMDDTLKVLGPTTSFLSYLKVSLIVAALISAPLWMWQFWQFIGAGLYRHERKSVYKFAPPMVLLFAGGVLFGYQLLIPVGLRYLLSFADPTVLQNWIGLAEYLTLFTTLTFVLGLTFQLPILMALFAKLQLVTIETYRSKRRYFILGAFIASALLTPPDAVTQCLMAAPLTGLYELGILCAWLVQSERRPIQWKVWRRRLAWAAAIIAALAIFQDRIRSAYRERLVAQKVRVAGEEVGDGVPYLELLRLDGQLGFEPEAAFRILTDDDGELWVVGADGRARLLHLTFKSQRVTTMSASAEEGRYLLSSAAQSVHVRVVREKPGSEFLGHLVTALEDASEENARSLEPLLAGLVGSRPAGAAAVGRETPAGDIGDTVAAWTGWWGKNRGSWVYRLEP